LPKPNLKVMSDFNILFTSAGRRVSLIRHFKKTLSDLNLKGRIYITDSKKDPPTLFIADQYFQTPRVTDPNYIETLKTICKTQQIKLLIPLIDTDLKLLSTHKHSFQKIGVTILVSSPQTIDICSDKRRTYEFFKKNGINTPEILNVDKFSKNAKSNFPIFLKPADGHSSLGATKITNLKELQFFIDYIPDAIAQNFMLGSEYTLDILVDFQAKVRSVVPRLRMETRAGEISKGVTVKNQDLISAGKKVVESLPGALGCITLQCFLSPTNEINFIEINPRFGGGIPLSLHAGADFPKWIIEMMLDHNPKISIDGWKNGVVMLRYDEAIFTTKEMTI
jgi:carbamoyl-phosphate synthase large subunit